MNIQKITKIALLTALVALTGSQCWGAAEQDWKQIKLEFEEAVRDGNTDTVRRLLQENNKEENELANLTIMGLLGGRLPAIAVAAQKNDIEMVNLLLCSGANVNALDNSQNAVMYHALNSPFSDMLNPEMIEILFEAGAIDPINTFGETALMVAARNPKSSPELLNLVINHSNIDAVNYKGKTALAIMLTEFPGAYNSFNQRAAQLLVNRGADIGNLEKRLGMYGIKFGG